MAHRGQVDVRIAAKAAAEAAAPPLIAPVEAEVRARLGDAVFGADGDTLEAVVATALATAARTLVLVEVRTGGLVSERLTSAPEAAGRVEALIGDAGRLARRLGVTPSRGRPPSPGGPLVGASRPGGGDRDGQARA